VTRFAAALVALVALGPQASPSPTRAAILLQSVQQALAEPRSDARDVRIEGIVSQLDALPDAEALDQKFTAHQRMVAYYRSVDADTGIVKHATWIIDRARRGTSGQRTKYTSAIVSAYMNMAQAWAGHGETDRAIALLERIPTDAPDIPSAPRSVKPLIEQLRLVGTPASTIEARRWLNVPAGQTTLDMKGHVTLLEFSAHWCIPCKVSYPTLARLREKYGPQGFRVVLATELYGFFERETKLDAEREIALNRAYYVAEKLDFPVAMADGVHTQDDNPNQVHYKVGGLPQIHLIDKRGIIRLVMFGFDKSNEPRLAKLVEGLLSER
jgi:thiol-disulfide isomerase/thioredoxin